MSLFSDAGFEKLSVYRKDFKYNRVPVVRYKCSGLGDDYPDPLCGPYTEYILPKFRYDPLPKPTPETDPVEYVKELLKRFPNLDYLLLCEKWGGPPDFEFINTLYDHIGESVYQVDFCRLHDFDSKTKQRRMIHLLPDDWITPLTTQRSSYRPPTVICPGGILSEKVSPPKQNLLPNWRERAILQTKTGDSELMGTIGALGQRILDEKMMGDIDKRPQFDPDLINKATLLMAYKN